MGFAFALAVAGAVFPLAGFIGEWTAQRDYTPPGSSSAIVLSAPSGHAPPALQWVTQGQSYREELMAVPLRLHAASGATWRGSVRGLQEIQHLHLFIERSPAGGYEAFIRNPESNAGASLGVRRVLLRGSTIRLERPGATPVTGRWRDGEIDLVSPGFPGTFAFFRTTHAASTAYQYAPPVATNDGWSIGSLGGVGINQAAIESIVNDIRQTRPSLRAPYIQALLIARHGKLVLDDYFNDFNRDRPHDVRSVGKSVTTLLVGRAIEETRSFSAETPVISLLPQYRSLMLGSPSKDRITVADLMSMSAGFACDDNDDVSPGNEDTMVSQTQQPDWYAYTLALPILFSPGSRALYCTAEINLLGALISKETGMWLPDYFYDRFALPMQFGEYAMWLMPSPVEDAYMGGGDYFLPRDVLKFGQLFLNHGIWNGTQIINDAWLRESAEKHSYVEDGGGDYGYGWHLSTYNVLGQQVQAILAAGNGGQLLYIFPQLDTAIFIAAGNYGQFPVWHRFETDLVPRLLTAVSQRGN